MVTEIERKYLVKTLDFLGDCKGKRLSQGYVYESEVCLARIRLSNENAWFTLKGKTSGLERDEFEYQIPLEDARQILKKFCKVRIVYKTRYEYVYDDICWDIDVFHGENEGLCLAEVELERADQTFIIPTWLDKEVSYDARYFSSQLARNPYKNWSEREDD